MKPNKNLMLLKYDFENSQFPQWYDESTKRTLEEIANDISQGKMTWNEFREFVDNNLGHNGFASDCLRYVQKKL